MATAVARARVGAGEGPAAQLGVDAHARARPSARPRPSPSSRAAGARRSRARGRRGVVTWIHPRKMSPTACIRRWPATTRWPALRYSLRPGSARAPRAGASLSCRNSGSSSSRPSSRAIQAARAHAAHPDDLAGEVDQAVAAPSGAGGRCSGCGGSRAGARAPSGRIASVPSDPSRSATGSMSGGSATMRGSPSTRCVKRWAALHAVLGRAPWRCTRSALRFMTLARGSRSPPAVAGQQLLHVRARVEDVQVARRRELGHRRAVAGARRP